MSTNFVFIILRLSNFVEKCVMGAQNFSFHHGGGGGGGGGGGLKVVENWN